MKALHEVRMSDDNKGKEEVFRECFNEIIQKYSLKVKNISEDCILLAGDKFLLSFRFHYGEIAVSYIQRNGEGKLEKWGFGLYLNKLTSEEEEKEYQRLPHRYLYEKELLRIAAILDKHMNNLLEGKKDWQKDYMTYEHVNINNIIISDVEEYANEHI